MASTRDKYLALAIKCMERELLFTSAPGCKPGFQLCEETLVTNTENILSNIYERHAIAWWQTRKIIKHPPAFFFSKNQSSSYPREQFGKTTRLKKRDWVSLVPLFFFQSFLSKIDFKQFLATEKLVKADKTWIFQMSEHTCVILKNIWLTLCFLFLLILLYKLSDQ